VDENDGQLEFGYFGKLPTLGDFIQLLLPQDFVNPWHEWVQRSMASAKESLGQEFLNYYLNCPAWKFLLSPGVCGLQAVAGLTIPSVDKVGRYFNFTFSTILPEGVDVCVYALNNQAGFIALEELALDILEQDLSRSVIETRTREITATFSMAPTTQHQFETHDDHLMISQDHARPFTDQSGALLSHLLSQELEGYSIWWYGLEGQTRSQLLVCRGMPTQEAYEKLLTKGEPPVIVEEELNYVDQMIAGKD
jgi:type VI secretion system protein ImpM